MNEAPGIKLPQQPAARSTFDIRTTRVDRGMWIIAVLFLLLLPLSTPRIYATDEVQYFAYLRSLYFDGDLDFRNEYRYFADAGIKNGDPAVFNALLRDRPDDPIVSPTTGLLRNVAPIGSAILWAPGYVLADAGVLIARGLGASIRRDGFDWPYIWAVCLMSALYALLGLLLSYRLARRYTGVFAATLATIGIWLATPLVFYTYILMPWSHTAGFFLFALFLTIWHNHKDKDGRMRDEGPTDRSVSSPFILHPSSFILPALLGLVGGLMVLTREQLGLLLIIVAADALLGYGRALLRRRRGEAGRLLAGHALFVAVFALTLMPQFLVYRALYGQPRPSTVVSGKLKLCSPHLFDTLVDVDPAPDPHQVTCGRAVEAIITAVGRPFDPNDWYFPTGSDGLKLKPLAHGALLWSPILVPALLGLAWLGRADRRLAWLLALALLGQVYINGAISTWHLTGSFGFRRLIEGAPIFILGLAALIDALRGPARRWAPILAVSFLIYWNVGLIAQWTVVRMPGVRDLRQGLVWDGMLRYQFVEVPRTVVDKIDTLVFHRCRLVKNC